MKTTLVVAMVALMATGPEQARLSILIAIPSQGQSGADRRFQNANPDGTQSKSSVPE